MCVLKLALPYDPAIPFLGIYAEKIMVQKDPCTPMFIAALFTVAKTWRPCKCPSTEEWIEKTWNVHTTEYDLAIKKKEIMPLEATRMGLGLITLSEESPTETDRHCTCGT